MTRRTARISKASATVLVAAIWCGIYPTIASAGAPPAATKMPPIPGKTPPVPGKGLPWQPQDEIDQTLGQPPEPPRPAPKLPDALVEDRA